MSSTGKYCPTLQLISLLPNHLFLARLSDNFRYRGSPWSDEQIEGKYEGPWQLGYVRDIDPSCLLKETKRVGWGPHPNRCR